MSRPRDRTRLVAGPPILRQVLDAYRPYADPIAEQGTRVLVVRFEVTGAAPPYGATRMQTSAVSAEQKTRTFTALGAYVDNLVLPDTVNLDEFGDRLAAANADPHIAAIIVQTPPPQRLVTALDRIDPTKDIDALGAEATRPACATADGITRVAAPFLARGEPTVAVAGSRGFVGRGVVELLRRAGHTPLELDQDDDLRQLRDVDIVLSATGRAGILTPEHLHGGHQLVVDSGFVPHPAGPLGDVHPSARNLPQVITPVPGGGIGPIEMATLSERLTIAQAAPELASWRAGATSTPTTTATPPVPNPPSPPG